MKLLVALAFAFSSLHATTFYVTVAGLGGEPEYEQRFSTQAQEIDKLIRAGGPDVKIQTLSGKQATKAQLQSVLSGIAREAKSGDVLILMIIGHGSFDGFDYKINLPGPDISAVELASLLDRIPTSRQLIVNMTSASGGSRAALEKPNRAVITATKSGSERNAPIFARYWVEALRPPTPTKTNPFPRSRPSSTPNKKPASSLKHKSASPPNIQPWWTAVKATARENRPLKTARAS